MTSRLADALAKHEDERARSIAAAARTLRPRWLVCSAETGEVLFSAALCRPMEKDGYVIVGVR